MKTIKIKPGEPIRIIGNVTMFSQHPTKIGGSSWKCRNPVLLLGKCNHKPKLVHWFKHPLGFRVSCKNRYECKKCGKILKCGSNLGGIFK